jgi:hypothetical protein
MRWVRCRYRNVTIPGHYLLNPAQIVMAWVDPDGGGFWMAQTLDGVEHMVMSEDNEILEGLDGR